MKKYKGLRSYAQKTVTAPEKIQRGGKTETLSYINADEARLLKSRGASGERTEYGVKSYQGDIDTSLSSPPPPSTSRSTGTTASTTYGVEGDVSAMSSIQRGLSGGGGGSPPPGDPSPPPPPPPPVNKTEYVDNPNRPNLHELYAFSKAGVEADMTTYLQKFAAGGGTPPSPVTNSTGGTTTYVYNAVDTGLPSTFAADATSQTVTATDSDGNETYAWESQYFKDTKGNTIGWARDDGTPGFSNKNQWSFDADGEDWVYVGEGSVEGGGGTGTTQVIGENGLPKTVGARTYANMLGYDKDKLKGAEEDRAKQVQKLKGMADRFGGKYDDITGEFLGGGLEAHFLSQSDKFDQKIAQMYGLTMQRQSFNADGTPRMVLDEATGEMKQAFDKIEGDTFWADLEKEAGQLPTDMQSRIYGRRADELVASESEQTADLQRMMAERNIDPTSPQAMRMRQQIKSGTRTAQREARRESLGDAMAVQAQQHQEKAGIRTQWLTGMQSQSESLFGKGTHYGAKSMELSGALLGEAADRQYGQESKKLAGLQMRMAKHAGEQDRDLAQQIAAMQAQGQGSGGGDDSSKWLGALAQGVGAYFALASDRTLKKKVRKATPSKYTKKDVSELLDRLKAYNFEYRDNKYGDGRRLGVMAQDLEKSKMGKKIVVDTPYGKVIDVGKGLGMALGVQANLNKRS